MIVLIKAVLEALRVLVDFVSVIKETCKV
jgi:hypothetical protein